MAINLPNVWERLLISGVTLLGSKSCVYFSGRLRSSKSMRPLFSALALLNIMRVMVAMAALATVGQCSGSSGWAQGNEIRSLSCPARLMLLGMPGTTASYRVSPRYPNARAATGGLKPGVC
jgi:hypothetical protein